MHKINFVEPQTPNWRNWCTQCQEEQEKHNQKIAAGERSSPKGRVYKGEDYGIKESIYFNPDGPFHGKCAYCGKKIASTQYGDVEHFRPKDDVSDENFNDIVGHPGYYWLCYDWKNLLPSCELCNRKSTTTENVIIGKHTRFPVRNFRATRPGEEVQEEPLLIHPIFEDPSEHIEVDATGVLYAKNGSDRGRTCINIFGLNYRDLPNERKERYNTVRDKMGMLFEALGRGGTSAAVAQDLLQEMQSIKEGRGEFTAVAIRAMKDAKQSIRLVIDD